MLWQSCATGLVPADLCIFLVGEVLAPRHVYQLLHVGIVDDEAELVELQIHILEHGLFERLDAAEDLLYGHGHHQHAHLALDNTVDQLVT